MIDLSPEKNIARDPALTHAQHRANREKLPMFVFVAPPGCGVCRSDMTLNTWFVRSAAEGQPEGAELYRQVAPEVPAAPAQPFPGGCWA